MPRPELFPTENLVHLADIKPRSNIQIRWEQRTRRHVHWFSECATEFVSRDMLRRVGLGNPLTLCVHSLECSSLSLGARRIPFCAPSVVVHDEGRPTGVGSAASYHLNPTNTEGLSSVFQIGIAYAMGVLFAFIVSVGLALLLSFRPDCRGIAGDGTNVWRTLQPRREHCLRTHEEDVCWEGTSVSRVENRVSALRLVSLRPYP